MNTVLSVTRKKRAGRKRGGADMPEPGAYVPCS